MCSLDAMCVCIHNMYTYKPPLHDSMKVEIMMRPACFASNPSQLHPSTTPIKSQLCPRHIAVSTKFPHSPRDHASILEFWIPRKVHVTSLEPSMISRTDSLKMPWDESGFWFDGLHSTWVCYHQPSQRFPWNQAKWSYNVMWGELSVEYSC